MDQLEVQQEVSESDIAQLQNINRLQKINGRHVQSTITFSRTDTVAKDSGLAEKAQLSPGLEESARQKLEDQQQLSYLQLKSPEGALSGRKTSALLAVKPCTLISLEKKLQGLDVQCVQRLFSFVVYRLQQVYRYNLELAKSQFMKSYSA